MSLGDQHREQRSDSLVRDLLFMSVVTIGFAAVIFRLYDVQVKRGDEFAKRSQDNFIQTKRIEHDRGEIVDREGRVLVANRSSFNVYVTPAFFPRTREVLQASGRALGLEPDEVEEARVALEKGASEGGPPILFARDVPEEEAALVREIQNRFEIPLEAVPIIPMTSDDGEPASAIYLDPRHFPTKERVFLRLEALLSLSESELEKLVRQSRVYGLDRYRDVMVRPDITDEQYEAIRQEIDLGDLPGVSLRDARARSYRYGQMGAHLLGYVNELTPEEYEDRRELGYRVGDHIGRRGVEQTFEDALRGVDGYEAAVVDSKGRPQDSQFASQLRGTVGARQEPRAGNRVVLSIDLDIQRAAEQAFTGRAGAVAVLEVETGRVLALTSTPTFDPNLVSGYFEKSERRRLHELRDLRPWRFRTIQDHFPPGSTFKVVTLLAALRNKEVGITENISCPGSFRLGSARFRCWKEAGHGSVDARRSIAKSCDVYYYTLGARLGLEPISKMAFDLGFGEPTGLDISGESSGTIPTVEWYKKTFGFYSLGAAVNSSIGQGAVAATTLQLAVAYATIANGGTVYEPQIALRVEAYDGSAVRAFEPVVRRKLDIPPAQMAVVRDGLFDVVNAGYGTAYFRRIKDADIKASGKTGTAQVAKLGAKRLRAEDIPWPLRDHAWFVAFAPSEAPQIAIAVFNEHGGHGGSGAAPTAMAVIKAWWEKQQRRAAGATELPSFAVLTGPDAHGHEAEELTWPAD